MKQTILLIGLPGVGKTTIGKSLYHQLPNSQFLDADELWRIHPFKVTDQNKQMVEHNVRSVYEGFINNPSLYYFIFTWVVANQELLSRLLDWFKDTNPIVILLECDKKVYLERLHTDKRDLSILERYDAIQENYRKMDVHKIDITHKIFQEIINEIYNLIKK